MVNVQNATHCQNCSYAYHIFIPRKPLNLKLQWSQSTSSVANTSQTTISLHMCVHAVCLEPGVRNEMTTENGWTGKAACGSSVPTRRKLLSRWMSLLTRTSILPYTTVFRVLDYGLLWAFYHKEYDSIGEVYCEQRATRNDLHTLQRHAVNTFRPSLVLEPSSLSRQLSWQSTSTPQFP
jgi:hypothetical protein